MEQKAQTQAPAQPEGDQQVLTPKRKKFHGFSMGFLMILLAVVVGLYVVCTLLAG